MDKEDKCVCVRVRARVCVCVCVHTHSGVLLSHENEILTFATTWMDLESITLSEMSMKDTLHYHLCV